MTPEICAKNMKTLPCFLIAPSLWSEYMPTKGTQALDAIKYRIPDVPGGAVLQAFTDTLLKKTFTLRSGKTDLVDNEDLAKILKNPAPAREIRNLDHLPALLAVNPDAEKEIVRGLFLYDNTSGTFWPHTDILLHKAIGNVTSDSRDEILIYMKDLYITSTDRTEAILASTRKPADKAEGFFNTEYK